MTHRKLVISVALLLSFSTHAALGADASFTQFWSKFKTAIEKNDKAAVASMTKLPFMLESKMANKTQFLAKYDELFPAKTRKCLAKGKPQADKNIYEVFCGEEIFVFEKTGGKWMFTEIGVND